MNCYMDNKPERKNMRLSNPALYDKGVFFLTFCTLNRACILSEIECSENLENSYIAKKYYVKLSHYGEIVDKYSNQLDDFYSDILVNSYIIMPNHVHILLSVRTQSGPSGTPVPTIQNSTVSRFVSTLKRFCNKEIGGNIWQRGSYDHIVRNRDDYNEILKYIRQNPANWLRDNLYCSGGYGTFS